MNIFKRLWYWITGKTMKNTGCELLRITGTKAGSDWVSINYSWKRGEYGPIKFRVGQDNEILVGPFPSIYFGKTLYVDAGKNRVEHVRVGRKYE